MSNQKYKAYRKLVLALQAMDESGLKSYLDQFMDKNLIDDFAAGVANINPDLAYAELVPDYLKKLARRRKAYENYSRYLEECKRRYPGGSLSD